MKCGTKDRTQLKTTVVCNCKSNPKSTLGCPLSLVTGSLSCGSPLQTPDGQQVSELFERAMCRQVDARDDHHPWIWKNFTLAKVLEQLCWATAPASKTWSVPAAWAGTGPCQASGSCLMLQRLAPKGTTACLRCRPMEVWSRRGSGRERLRR